MNSDSGAYLKESSESSGTPPPPTTEPWTAKLSAYIGKLKSDAVEKSDHHDIAGHYFRKMEVRLGIPAIVTPAIFGPVVMLVAAATEDRCDTVTIADYVSTVGFVLTSVFTTIYSFYGFGTRSHQHHSYAAKYSDIITDIESELVKKKEYRTHASVFVTTMKMKYDHLVFGEPTIPLHVTKGQKKNTEDMRSVGVLLC